MSKREDKVGAPEEAAFERLEAAIQRLVEGLSNATDRAEGAASHNAELTKAVERFGGDGEEVGRMVSRLKRLETENADLRARLDVGRDGVDRMIARIRFLENQS